MNSRNRIFLITALVALLPLGLGNANARTFSAASLKGTCIWQSVSIPTSSGDAEAAGPATILASVHFNGDGALTFDYDVNINGTFTSTDAVPGTYSVDSSGHGNFTFTSPASANILTYDFRLSSNRHTLYTIVQTYAGRSVTPRVAYGTCTFQESESEEARRD